MKKLLGIMLALALTVAVGAAYATPSKTASDLTQTGDTNLPGVVVYVTTSQASVDAAAAVVMDMAAKATAGVTAAGFFGEALQADIAAAFPAGKDLSTLVVNELAPLAISGYAAGMGDVVVPFQFATVYQEGQPVVAMLGFVGADGVVEWHVLQAEVVAGGIVNVTIPADLALRMTTETTVLAILN